MQIGLDTNILVHATVVQDRDKHEKAQEFIRRLLKEGEYLISLQVVAEYYYTVTRIAPQLVEEAMELVEILATPENTVHYDLSTINEALEKSGNRRRFWDTLIALTSERAGAEAVATENEEDFKGIIKTINPFR